MTDDKWTQPWDERLLKFCQNSWTDSENLHNEVIAPLLAERDLLRKALLKASEALFDACPYIDQWERRMPVRRAAEAAREAAHA